MSGLTDTLRMLTSVGEVVSGSDAERRIVDIVKNMFSSIDLDVRVMEVPVDSWCDLGATVRIGGFEFNALTTPPTLSSSVDGRIVHVKDPLGLKWPDVSNSIALCELPQDPDELKTVYLRAYDFGAEAVIVYVDSARKLPTLVVEMNRRKAYILLVLLYFGCGLEVQKLE